MTDIPKSLATRHLLNPDIGKAAPEAQSNAMRLILSGYFDAARHIVVALLSPGPWRLAASSHLAYATWQKLYWLDEQSPRDRPPLDESPEMAQEARGWLHARKQPAGMKPWLMALCEHQPKSTKWSATELDAIVASVTRGAFSREFLALINDAKAVLAQRVRARNSQPGDHAAIADAVERGVRIAHPKDVATFSLSVAWQAALLDLIDGNTAAAAERLGRLLPHFKFGDGQVEHAADFFNVFDPAFTPLYASHALAPAFGLSEAGVDAYLHEFFARAPNTLTAAPEKPWKTVLAAYAKRAQADEDAEGAAEYLEWSTPRSEPLLQLAQDGKLLNRACDESDVVALEARLGTALPPSYREFLLSSDGMVVPTFGVSLLPAAQVDWFRSLDEVGAIDIWNDGRDEATDEQYAVYGADQDCVHMRPRHLRTALQISTSADGDVLLLIPDVRFGPEWEAWFFGNKNPGAYRYRSFRDLMEQCVLATRP